MPIDFYYTPTSPACRTVELAAAALNVTLKPHKLDLTAKEHLKPEFVAINPQHSVPTIVDDGLALWESRAIIRYLANAYGANTNLYPKEPKARALVDLRLDFDLGTLYASHYRYFVPVYHGAEPDPENLKKLEDALKHFDTFLSKSKFAAGDELTIADISLVVSVSSIEAVKAFSVKTFPNISRWYELVKQTTPKYKELTAVWYQGVEKLLKEKGQNKK